ncbi:uncharacterized protein LOC135924293 [Gordionus sp. m RMFG-2023]|uniref:uncharacterized protein LOC135924293 n=1 Tax=Gordionus sp. m RMFG-2023 TaxID=3053472 RepID=UPI0031FC3D9C
MEMLVPVSNNMSMFLESTLTVTLGQGQDHFYDLEMENYVPDVRATSNFSHKCKIISKKIDQGDVCGALKLASSNDKLAPFDEHTFTLLKELHPQAFPEDLPIPIKSNLIEIGKEELIKTILSFNKNSTGGIDGFRPSYFQFLINPKNPHKDTFVNSLVILSENILNNDLPSQIHQILFGARLIAFTKPDGGVRPIAIGSFFRRLLAKIIVERFKPDASKMFQTYQLGFGTKGGCEIAAHSLRIYIEDPPPDAVVCKLDFKNAFNSLSRKTFLNIFYEKFPFYARFIEQSYGCRTPLKFGEYTIPSDEGIQQGDPLGPLIFSLDLNIWYLDDGTICGPSKNILAAIDYIEKNSLNIGLTLNKAKSEICFLNSNTLKVQGSLLENILNIKLEDFNWGFSQLPSKMGGLDLYPLNLLSLSSFLASRLMNNAMISSFISPKDNLLNSALTAWTSLAPPEAVLPTILTHQSLFEPLIKKFFKIISSNPPLEYIQLLQNADCTSGYEWLEALPSRNLGNLLSDEQLRVAIGHRLGCNIVQPHTCIKCKTLVDSKGRHGLNCIYSQGRHARHAAINLAISRSLTRARIPNILEPTNLSLDDGLRPDGLTSVPWSLGKSLIWDFTCVSSFPKNLF